MHPTILRPLKLLFSINSRYHVFYIALREINTYRYVLIIYKISSRLTV